MTDIKPRFFESENKVLAHLEWEAIRMICLWWESYGALMMPIPNLNEADPLDTILL